MWEVGSGNIEMSLTTTLYIQKNPDGHSFWGHRSHAAGTLHAWPGNLPLARVHLDRPARAPTGGSCSLLCFRARRALQHRRTQQVAASAPIPWALPESNGVGSTGTLTARIISLAHAAWSELGYWEATKAQGPQQQNQGWRRLDGGRGGEEAAQRRCCRRSSRCTGTKAAEKERSKRQKACFTAA